MAVGWQNTEAIADLDGGGTEQVPAGAVALFGKSGHRSGPAFKSDPPAAVDIGVVQ